MTESTPSTPAKKLDFARIFPTLFRPQRTFAEIAAESGASWQTPMLALSVSAALAVFVSGYFKARAAMMGEMQLPPDWQYWTTEMQNNFMQAQQATQSSTFVYIIPLVLSLAGLWAGWLILSGLLHLASTLLGGRGTMGSALNVAAWASLPFFVRDALRAVFMLLAGHVIVSPGLSGFANGTIFLAKLLAQVDIFFFWNFLLLVIGFSLADGLPKNKAAVGTLAVTLLLAFSWAGAGAFISTLGGTLSS